MTGQSIESTAWGCWTVIYKKKKRNEWDVSWCLSVLPCRGSPLCRTGRGTSNPAPWSWWVEGTRWAMQLGSCGPECTRGEVHRSAKLPLDPYKLGACACRRRNYPRPEDQPRENRGSGNSRMMREWQYPAFQAAGDSALLHPFSKSWFHRTRPRRSEDSGSHGLSPRSAGGRHILQWAVAITSFALPSKTWSSLHFALKGNTLSIIQDCVLQMYLKVQSTEQSALLTRCAERPKETWYLTATFRVSAASEGMGELLWSAERE